MADTQQPDVILHAGVHKTATTHLQRCLQNARGDIFQDGVQFLGPRQLRGEGNTIADRFALPHSKLPPEKRPDIDVALTALRYKSTRIVISEENFIGTLNRTAQKNHGMIYPQAARRMTALAEVVAPNGIDVFLCVRAPSMFLNSAYSQYLMSGGKSRAEAFKKANPIRVIKWGEMVRRIASAKGVRSVFVWAYEDYEDLFSRITALMLGGTAAQKINWLNERTHLGLSRPAVDSFLNGKSNTVKAARETFPVSDGHPPFDAFTPAEHAESGVLYADQIQEIAAMRNVILLQP